MIILIPCFYFSYFFYRVFNHCYCLVFAATSCTVCVGFRVYQLRSGTDMSAPETQGLRQQSLSCLALVSALCLQVLDNFFGEHWILIKIFLRVFSSSFIADQVFGSFFALASRCSDCRRECDTFASDMMNWSQRTHTLTHPRSHTHTHTNTQSGT